jgi:DNA polymerase-4
VALANLDDDGVVQLELPFARFDPSRLDGVLDNVRDKYGTTAITRGVLLGQKESMTVPLLPD